MNALVAEEKNEKVFTELTPYLKGAFLDEICPKNLIRTNLNNVNELLSGGLNAGVYSVVGKFHEALFGLSTHLIEDLASQKMAVIYITENEKRKQFIQQLIVRHYYKQMRDQAPSLSSIIHEINTNSLERKNLLKSLETITNRISVIERKMEPEELERRLIKQKKKYNKLAVFVDSYFYGGDIGWIFLNSFANELSIPVFISHHLSTNDCEQLRAGFPPYDLFRRSDYFMFLDELSPQIKEETFQKSTTIYNLEIFSELLPYKTKQTQLTYHNDYYYFQDA
ncbi:hypothetical protein [Alkalihalobacterium bogoriense]|uniref:hypothetical protein n=1 Tax=Alkalihalobacterium bogoriense TaxID=246272 RepID=UPI00047D92A4|nr:hypothetical protein [Alkalihalobacterium bogoriense]